MKMKFITAVVAFSATFFFSLLLVGFPKTNYSLQHQCSNQARYKVTSLLEQDIAFGHERDTQVRSLYLRNDSSTSIYTSTEYAEIVTEYVRYSESLDDTTLPQDFRFAWRDHMRAWREHANFLNQAEGSFFSEDINRSEFFKLFWRQDQEITDTWRKVKVVGRKYGANVQY
jgi:hypothetical protein